MNRILFSSGSEHWATPGILYRALNEEFNFNFDPCPIEGNSDGLANLLTPWGGDFCTFCNTHCGIAEKMINLGHENKEMYEMSDPKEFNKSRVSSQSEDERRIRLMVSGLPKGSGKRENAIAPVRSKGIAAGSGAKEEAFAIRKGQRNETPTKRDGQPLASPETGQYKMELDPGTVANVQEGLESEVCVLWQDRSGVDARSLHPAGRADLPRNSAGEHGPGMSCMQHKQAAPQSLPLVQRQGAPCPHCGAATIIKGFRVWVNPPYGPGVDRWLQRAGEADLSVFLLPARTDTRWFHELVLPCAQEVRFLKGRLRFGDSKNDAPFPSMIIVFSRDHGRQETGQLTMICEPEKIAEGAR